MSKPGSEAAKPQEFKTPEEAEAGALKMIGERMRRLGRVMAACPLDGGGFIEVQIVERGQELRTAEVQPSMSDTSRAECLLRSIGYEDANPEFATDVLAVATQFTIVRLNALETSAPKSSAPGLWRTGRKVENTIYYGDVFTGSCVTPEMAVCLVAAANAGERESSSNGQGDEASRRGRNDAQPQDHDDVDCCGSCGRLFPRILKIGEGQSTHCRCDGSFVVTMFDAYRCSWPSHRTPNPTTQVNAPGRPDAPPKAPWCDLHKPTSKTGNLIHCPGCYGEKRDAALSAIDRLLDIAEGHPDVDGENYCTGYDAYYCPESLVERVEKVLGRRRERAPATDATDEAIVDRLVAAKTGPGKPMAETPNASQDCPECGEPVSGYGPDWCKTHADPNCPNCDQVLGHAGSCVWTAEDIEKINREAEKLTETFGTSSDRPSVAGCEHGIPASACRKCAAPSSGQERDRIAIRCDEEAAAYEGDLTERETGARDAFLRIASWLRRTT